MKRDNSRRSFIRMSALSGVGLRLGGSFPLIFSETGESLSSIESTIKNDYLEGNPFVPNRAASWWCTLEDLQWSQKHIVEKIKRRAEGFAKAKIDTAINFGFHMRFDFSNYFGQLHGYYANVCEELHTYGIRFMDHYSCNHVARPRGEADFKSINKFQRHSVLLFHDPVAAQYAQYEGHKFNDICEVDLRDGKRGYARQYQLEAFCHNNPAFLDMHQKYLGRLVREVPFDGIEVDDMCSYPGNTTCGCKYCRDRFKRDYGHSIPTFPDTSFFGDITKDMLKWGNYENPAFRDWIRMKTESIVDHVKIIKNVIGNKPLMTCSSSTGPIFLNAVALNLEKMAPHLDLFMLENVGTNVKNVDWVLMDAEALHQKDIALKRGNAPILALSYTIYEVGAYLGWALSRYWGVSNWSSTLNYRLEEDPPHPMEQEDVISRFNNWEIKNSNLDHREGNDLVEVRLVNNSYCRENGWRDKDGFEHWDRSKAWSAQLVNNNVGYCFVRSTELADETALLNEISPLILDGVACISDKQFTAIKSYLSKGGIAWLALPFGIYDEKGFERKVPLSVELIKNNYKKLVQIDTALSSNPLQKLILEGRFHPVIKQLKGDSRWAVRIRIYKDKPVIHFMNRALLAVPDTVVKDISGIPILKDIESTLKEGDLVYEINASKLRLPEVSLLSPEIYDEQKPVNISNLQNGFSTLRLNLDGIKIYAVVQTVK